MNTEFLFEEIVIGSLKLSNRIVMSPMTRAFSPGGVPGVDVAGYYGRRAEGGVGLIVTEGTWVPHPGASNEENVPDFHGPALEGWSKVVKEVHAKGGKIIPQLWHAGLFTRSKIEGVYESAGSVTDVQVGPSGMVGAIGTAPVKLTREMTQADIDAVIEAFAQAARSAFDLGFDGVGFHGGHGYLFDQFFWDKTNLRQDRYGGDLVKRTCFATEVLKECRTRTSADYPLMFRLSQWKLHDYGATLVNSPQELEQFLTPLVDAGVDIFDCSQRRFWEPAFEGSDLNLAGWVKKITGKPTMTVGSVGLDVELMATLMGETSQPASLDKLLAMFERGDFDLIGVGRAILADPSWVEKVRRGAHNELQPFNPAALASLS
ncbi:NADH:flavin oxidoreductase [Noviherbaspirillum sedimenti]|uniref:12-oxophytodienoate reductase n=1 Tax=Noviherbaspirillum sedimenti TaxID=2320865 RepID=A0A3A3FYQ4_9BURK|nr:NADH:flavin oxidoreductase [Noviherbaspirillum sedimenti]RJG01338.1 12-oxophytodienoate reductase [Noviherbaspirillum sedimenti]